MRLDVVLVVVLAIGLAGCGDQDGTRSGGDKSAATSGGKMFAFVSTLDGKPLQIRPELFDTPAAKEFVATGRNPYVGQQAAINQGKKLFQMYSCTQCHGSDGQGQTGPSLQGPNYKYAKDATSKGMFETIWNGTNGGMGAKGKGLMDATDANNGLLPDEVLKIEAWLRTHGRATGNE